MAHPYKAASHKNDPKWLRGLDKHVEKTREGDLDAVIRDHGGDKQITAKATYVKKDD